MMWNLQCYPTTVLNEKCDILGDQTYSDPSYIFSGGQDPLTPVICCLGFCLAAYWRSDELVYALRYDFDIAVEWSVLSSWCKTYGCNSFYDTIESRRDFGSVFYIYYIFILPFLLYNASVVSPALYVSVFWQSSSFCRFALSFWCFFSGQFPWVMFIVVRTLSMRMSHRLF